MTKRKTSPAITEYDKKRYDYSKYWELANREYEQEAEIIALQRIINRIPKENRELFVDFGGGYGRLMPVYAQLFKHVVLLDYSTQNLSKGVENAEKYGIKNITFIASNLYHLPFRNQSIYTGAIIRVLHHIKDTNLLFAELGRTIKNYLILDCPNKRHFLALVRSLFKGKLRETLSDKPYHQPHREDSQDYTGGPQIFLNFNPRTIEKTAKAKGLNKIKTLSVSNLRNQTAKKILPRKLLIGLERCLQYLGAPLLFGPHIWMLFEKKHPIQPKSDPFLINEILICPKCRSGLKFSASGAKCKGCYESWKLDGKIWDFRHS